MLDFFRKYQKAFFILVATMVISSFIFFGTFGAMEQGPIRTDRVVGKAIDGSDVKFLEISALSRFLATDQEDLGTQVSTINLLNDGVIRKDILGSGIGAVLVNGHYDALKEELDGRFQRIKTFRFYEHPETPFLSAKAVWQRLSPKVNEHCAHLQAEPEMNQANFAHLVELYQLQSALPGEWLRRILLMQEQQYNWLHPDPELRQRDLAMFGFHSLTDWFGKNFVDLSAEFIHNAAICAVEKGYKVSLKEAKADLRANFAAGLRKFQTGKEKPEIRYQDQLRMLGVDETEAAEVWRKILLFRRYFADLGNSLLLDRMAHTEFSSVANEKVVVDLYQWPSSFKCKTAYTLYALETYLKHAAAHNLEKNLRLPTTFLSPEIVERTAPELVAIPYQAKVFAVDKREIALKAPLKELWAFETEDAVWKSLKSEFPAIAGLQSSGSPEERFAILEKLDPQMRSKIDAYARLKLIERHPDWVKQALDGASGEEKKLFLSAGKIELPYVDEPAKLGSLFLKIPESPETVLEELTHFESKTAFFRFENIEKLSNAKVKTFEEALNDRSLPKMVDRTLEAEFSSAKSLLPVEKSQNFSAAKEEIAELMLDRLKKQYLDQAQEMEGSWVLQCMGAMGEVVLTDLQKNQSDSAWIATAGEDPLISQFKMRKTEKEILRTIKEDWMSKESFVLIPNEWSSVHVESDGAVMFMYVKAKQANPSPIIDPLIAGKQVLSSDVGRVLAEQILGVMQKKRAVILPLQPDQE